MKTLGFGGVFFRVENVKKMVAWYHDVFGIEFLDWNGSIFLPTDETATIFSVCGRDNDYFPKEQKVMLNFQIEDFESFLNHLSKLEIPIIRAPEKNAYGFFVWIKDPEGNMVEVWERGEF